MRTLIFSTKEEAEPIQKLLGGEIFTVLSSSKAVGGILNHLDQDENAIAIIVGNSFVMGWATHHPTNVLFSANYPGNKDIRTQALGRVRWQPRTLDRATLVNN